MITEVACLVLASQSIVPYLESGEGGSSAKLVEHPSQVGKHSVPNHDLGFLAQVLGKAQGVLNLRKLYRA
jgi:hypothetical protein